MSRTLVAIVNSHADTVNLLRRHLEQEGLQAVTCLVEASKYGLAGFIELLKKHDPAIVIYNIALPCKAERALVRLVMDFEARKGRRFVLTTTSEIAAARLAAHEEVHELIRKPQDFAALARFVKELLSPDA